MNNHLEIKIIHTTDVHGSFFPYDFINSCKRKGSLARVSTYVKRLRKEYGKRFILLTVVTYYRGNRLVITATT